MAGSGRSETVARKLNERLLSIRPDARHLRSIRIAGLAATA